LAAPVLAQSNDNRIANAGSGSVTVGNTTISSAGAPDADLNMARYKAWDDFQSSNHNLAREIKHNPKLVRNASFVDKHAQLKQLFEANAGMQQDMEQNPGNYTARMMPGRHHHNHHQG
jgi:hypothetical protein